MAYKYILYAYFFITADLGGGEKWFYNFKETKSLCLSSNLSVGKPIFYIIPVIATKQLKLA